MFLLNNLNFFCREFIRVYESVTSARLIINHRVTVTCIKVHLCEPIFDSPNVCSFGYFIINNSIIFLYSILIIPLGINLVYFFTVPIGPHDENQSSSQRPVKLCTDL